MEHVSGATDCLRRLSWHRGGQRPSASVRRLLAHGADPNLRDSRHHCTPLEERAWKPSDDAAAASESLSVVKKRRASSWQSGLPNIPQLPSPPDLTPKMIAVDVC
jgi:hypothetical protein